MSDKKEKKDGFMLKLAGFIVGKRNLIFLIYILMFIFSFFAKNWVKVENDLAAYLPSDSETRQGLDVMEREFTTFGTAQIMVANITKEKGWELQKVIEEVEGVRDVTFDETRDHYNHLAALYTVTFNYDQKQDACVDSLEKVKKELSGYDIYVSTELGDGLSEAIDAEVQVIMVIVAIIVTAVITLTSQTYAEIPVLLLTFVSAAIVNMGTNFLMGTISFVSNSVTTVLQLALSLDYAIILCNRYKEERQTMSLQEAVIVALSKAIPEIGASSLTTIGGLIAMMFMQFKIGPDMAICLIKAILLALLSVFVLMPGLLVLFGPLMEKTKHRNFVPKIPFVGRFAYATRLIIPPIFVVVVIAAMLTSGKCPYAYGYESLETPKLNETQMAENMIEENFSNKNMLALVVPTGDYEKERQLLQELDAMEEIDTTMGLANIEAMDGYMLADNLNPRQFSELAEVEYELAQIVYTAYAAEHGEYGEVIGNISSYEVPLIDMFLFVCEQVDAGVVNLDDEKMQLLKDGQEQMENAKVQLKGDNYSRMLIYLNLPESGEKTYEFIDTMRETAQKYYPKGGVYVVGNSTTEYDFQKSFRTDNTVVSLVSILIVLGVLLFNFRSVAMPILLILVIQGCIWMNFSVPTLTEEPLFFMSYLVVSSIQMGANIDYAIVIASRYLELKDEMDHKEAIIETMNFAFPTIITSGTILAVAGILIGQMTSDACIVGIGQSLGRGTIMSILLVMFVLPQILLPGGKLVDLTSFSVPLAIRRKEASGRVRVDGYVHGEISGTVTGMVRGFVDGAVNVNLISGTVEKEIEAKEKEEAEE